MSAAPRRLRRRTPCPRHPVVSGGGLHVSAAPHPDHDHRPPSRPRTSVASLRSVARSSGPGGLTATTRGFLGVRRAERGPRLPHGQYDVGAGWPVLTAEATPRI